MNENEIWLQSGNFGTDTSLEEFEGIIIQFFSDKEDYLRIYTKKKTMALLKQISLDIIKISSKSIGTMEKINTLNEKIIEYAKPN